MMNLLLTSCGLETDIIRDRFLQMLSKRPEDVRALFIPTAAIDPDSIEVLHKCLYDLTDCGISRKHITIYDLHEAMDFKTCADYDVIYLCGGKTAYLLSRILEQGFQNVIDQFLRKGGVVLGVSAGSVIFAENLPNNLGALCCPLFVHASEEEKEQPGRYPIDRTEPLHLGNRQAICWEEEELVIFE